MSDKKQKKRGPNKKEGFRQDLRITPIVEKAFDLIKEKYSLKHNSEALHIIAELFLKTI
ncbi:MAG: hypothetical protein PHC34_07715 [Candidatus Gastranaerophilales bacterium]|nr:hypothetical protein [Candidatus Gastranaerophilales bacterium]